MQSRAQADQQVFLAARFSSFRVATGSAALPCRNLFFIFPTRIWKEKPLVRGTIILQICRQTAEKGSGWPTGGPSGQVHTHADEMPPPSRNEIARCPARANSMVFVSVFFLFSKKKKRRIFHGT